MRLSSRTIELDRLRRSIRHAKILFIFYNDFAFGVCRLRMKWETLENYSMIRQYFAAMAMTILGMMSLSCGGTAVGLSAVSGKVLCNGEPAAGAVLSFHRQAGEAAPPPTASVIIPSATVQDDGSFVVDSHPLGRGAAPGKYNILVQWSQDQDPAQKRGADKAKVSTIKGKRVVLTKHDKLDQIAPDRLRGRYSDASKPLLQVEVKPGSSDLGTLELELKN